MRIKHSLLSLSIALIIAPASAAQADAQDRTQTDSETTPAKPKQPTELDDIVVTALRRETVLQKVPASVAAIRGDTLREKGQTQYRDYLNYIPGVSYVSNGSYKDKIFIRGVSEGLSARTTATTGIYIDDVSVSEVDSSLADIGMYDIDRVEVLRGPQGTLFGAGAVGGAVRIITNKPAIGSTEFNASADVFGVEGGGTGTAFNAAGNIPINDMFALRLVLGKRRNPGFIDNVVDGPLRAKNVNNSQQDDFRAQLLFEPNDRFNVLLAYQYNKSDYNYNTVQDVGLTKQIVRNYPEYNNFKTNIVSATVNASFDYFNLISSTAYVDKKSETGRDLTVSDGADYTDYSGKALTRSDGLGLLYVFPNRVFSQEVRLQSNTSGRISWLAGAYYSRSNPTNLQYYDSDYLSGLQGLDLYTAISKSLKQNTAVFSEWSYRITPSLTATAGARVTKVRSSLYSYNSGYYNDDEVSVGNYASHETFDTYKYALSYQLNERSLLYVQASSGFRPGFTNDSVTTTSCVESMRELGLSGSPGAYTSDSIWSYEIGSKNTFLDNRLTVNGAIYRLNWDDIQVPVNLSCGSQLILNAGKAKSTGGELEVSTRPFRGLDLDASVGYVDATLETTNAAIGALAGDRVPNTAKWNGSLSARYGYDVDAGQVYARLTYQYVGERYSDFRRSSKARLNPAYALVNARTGFTTGQYDVSFYVNNVFNKNAIVNSVIGSAGLSYENVVTPRTYGLGVQYHY
jgi:iron complex outermembrane recepter protein